MLEGAEDQGGTDHFLIVHYPELLCEGLERMRVQVRVVLNPIVLDRT